MRIIFDVLIMHYMSFISFIYFLSSNLPSTITAVTEPTHIKPIHQRSQVYSMKTYA